MNLIIDKNGNAGFDEWFNERDAERIAKALEDAGFDVMTLRVDYEFKDVPALKKKERYDPIPMTAKNIFLLLANADKDNDEILELIGIERESNFVVTTLIRRLQGEYQKWQKLDHPVDWANEEERLKAFAGYLESRSKISDRGIVRAIEKMEKDGCLQLADEKFPECGKQFNNNCLTCQFNKNHIQNESDIRRFNMALESEFEDAN